MKVGISEWGLHQNFGRGVTNPRPLTALEYIELAASWKADGVQLESTPPPTDEKALSAIRSKVESLGLYVEVEAGGFNPEKLTLKLQASKAIGAKVMRTFPLLKRYSKEPPLAEQLRIAEENLRKIAPLAEKLGVVIGVENHLMALEKQDISGYELAELLDRIDSPFIGVCLDTGNCLGFIDEPVAMARALAPRVVTVHFKDYRIKRTFDGAEIAGCPLGDGCVDLRAIVALLRELSPMKDELCLNIEAPVERLEIPFLTPRFWDGYGEGYGARLPEFLRFLAARGEPSGTDFRIPAELGRPIEEILSHERESSIKSIKYVRGMLKT